MIILQRKGSFKNVSTFTGRGGLAIQTEFQFEFQEDIQEQICCNGLSSRLSPKWRAVDLRLDDTRESSPLVPYSSPWGSFFGYSRLLSGQSPIFDLICCDLVWFVDSLQLMEQRCLPQSPETRATLPFVRSGQLDWSVCKCNKSVLLPAKP